MQIIYDTSIFFQEIFSNLKQNVVLVEFDPRPIFKHCNFPKHGTLIQDCTVSYSRRQRCS